MPLHEWRTLFFSFLFFSFLFFSSLLFSSLLFSSLLFSSLLFSSLLFSSLLFSFLFFSFLFFHQHTIACLWGTVADQIMCLFRFWQCIPTADLQDGSLVDWGCPLAISTLQVRGVWLSTSYKHDFLTLLWCTIHKAHVKHKHGIHCSALEVRISFASTCCVLVWSHCKQLDIAAALQADDCRMSISLPSYLHHKSPWSLCV